MDQYRNVVQQFRLDDAQASPNRIEIKVSDFVKKLRDYLRKNPIPELNSFHERFIADASLTARGVPKPQILILELADGKKFIAKIITRNEYKITEYIIKNISRLCREYIVSPTLMTKFEFLMGIHARTGQQVIYVMYLLVLPFYPKNSEGKGRLTSLSISQTVMKYKIQTLFRMAFAMYCLHEKGITHADIKDENYFGEKALLGDFGVSSTVDLSIGESVMGIETIPPEMYDPRRRSAISVNKASRSIDVWGYGVMAIQYFLTNNEYRIDKLFGYDTQSGYVPRSITPSQLITDIRDPRSDLYNLLTQRVPSGMWFFQSLLSPVNERKPIRDIILEESKQGGFFYPLRNDPDFKVAIEYIGGNRQQTVRRIGPAGEGPSGTAPQQVPQEGILRTGKAKAKEPKSVVFSPKSMLDENGRFVEGLDLDELSHEELTRLKIEVLKQEESVPRKLRLEKINVAIFNTPEEINKRQTERALARIETEERLLRRRMDRLEEEELQEEAERTGYGGGTGRLLSGPEPRRSPTRRGPIRPNPATKPPKR